jgi:hypothetical protein
MHSGQRYASPDKRACELACACAVMRVRVRVRTFHADGEELDDESLPGAKQRVVEGATVRSHHSHHLCATADGRQMRQTKAKSESTVLTLVEEMDEFVQVGPVLAVEHEQLFGSLVVLQPLPDARHQLVLVQYSSRFPLVRLPRSQPPHTATAHTAPHSHRRES